MTILNVHLEPDRALIAINTEGIRVDGSHGDFSKLLVLPHAGAVLAGRGQMVLVVNVFLDLLGAMTDFDATAQVLQQSAHQRMEHLYEEARRTSVNVNLDTHLVLVGWSSSKEKMLMHSCIAVPGEPARVTEITEPMLSPWDQRWGAAPSDWGNHQEMLVVARTQGLYAERDFPRQGWRGALTIAELSRDSITITSCQDFSA